MLEWFAKLPVRKRVGILAIVLGFIAIFLGNPYNKVYSKVNLNELAIKAVPERNEISPVELANWIIKGNQDYYLIDLRPENEYVKYHIPTAISSPVQNLVNLDVPKNEKVVIYSDDELNTAKGWFILKAEDYKSVNILKKGLNGWKDSVLFPSFSNIKTKQQKEYFAKISEISKFFGGQPQVNSGNVKSVKMVMPKLKIPKQITLKMHKKKKKREGC